MTAISRKTSSQTKAVFDLAKVYFVEDSPAEIALLKATFKLKNIHLNARYFRNGEELVEQLSCDGRHGRSQDGFSTSEMPDLIIIDLNLPTMPGLELLHLIKSAPATAKIPVVMISGASDAEDAKKALGEGSLQYCTKPLDIDGLKEIAALAINLQFEVRGDASYLCRNMANRTQDNALPGECFSQ